MEIQIGSFKVVTTNNGGHSPEFYADCIVERLLKVSETAPEPIKTNALIFRESMRAIILDGIERAIISSKQNIVQEKY